MFGRLGYLIKRFGLTDQSYRFLFEPEPANEAVSLDCETTGFDPWTDEIVSIAAIRINGRRIHASSSFRALVRPEGAMRPDAIKVHQLRQQDVAQAQPMSEVLPELLIDVSELYYDRKYSRAPPGTRVDLRYAAIRADLKLPVRAQHDAFEDALGAAEMYLLLEDMRERGVRFPRHRPEFQGDFAIT